MTVIKRESLVALALCLTLYHLPRAEAALNCYTSQPADDGSIKEECGMQTGCIKKFYQKTQKVVEKGCFLVPSEDQCFVEEKNWFRRVLLYNRPLQYKPRPLDGFLRSTASTFDQHGLLNH